MHACNFRREAQPSIEISGFAAGPAVGTDLSEEATVSRRLSIGPTCSRKGSNLQGDFVSEVVSKGGEPKDIALRGSSASGVNARWRSSGAFLHPVA